MLNLVAFLTHQRLLAEPGYEIVGSQTANTASPAAITDPAAAASATFPTTT